MTCFKYGTSNLVLIKGMMLLIFTMLISSSGFSQTAESLVESGKLKLKTKDIDAALNDFTNAIKLNPKYELAYVNRALCRMAQGKWEQAIPDCNKALEINSKQAVAFFVRGCAKANTQKNGCDDLRKSLSLGFAQAQQGLNQFCN